MLLGISLVLAVAPGAANTLVQAQQDERTATSTEKGDAATCPYACPFESSSGFGFALAGGGDVNGDQVADFAVGSPWYFDGGPFTGRVEVLSGKDASVLHTYVGESQKGMLGFSVCIPGDLTGDGRPDVVAGAPLACRVLVWSGADGALVRRIGPRDELGGSWFGAAIAPVGDLDGDDVTDLAIGAPRHEIQGWGSWTPPDPLICGRVYLVSGKSGETIRTLGTELSNGPELLSRRFASDFGRSLCPLGDIDGDGTPDLAVGAPGEPFLWFYGRASFYLPAMPSLTPTTFHRPRALFHELTYEYDSWCGKDKWFEAGVGRAYVFSGRDGSLLRTISSGGTQDGFGSAVADVGDVDGDGRDDLAWAPIATPPNPMRMARSAFSAAPTASSSSSCAAEIRTRSSATH